MGGDLATNKKGVRTMAAAGGVPDRKGGFGPTIKGRGGGWEPWKGGALS